MTPAIVPYLSHFLRMKLFLAKSYTTAEAAWSAGGDINSPGRPYTKVSSKRSTRYSRTRSVATLLYCLLPLRCKMLQIRKCNKGRVEWRSVHQHMPFFDFTYLHEYWIRCSVSFSSIYSTLCNFKYCISVQEWAVALFAMVNGNNFQHINSIQEFHNIVSAENSAL